MAVSAKWYGQAFAKAFNKEIDFDTDTVKVMLCTSAYTPDQDAHAYLSSVTGEVASGNGYTTGGVALTSKTATYNAATNTFTLDAADVSWANSTITARYAVVYDDSPATAATKPLLGYVDFGGDVSSTAGAFAITWDAAGMLTLTAS